MNKVIAPEATALWLKSNTQLTTYQIAQACGLSVFEIDALEPSETSSMILQQFTKENIEECEKNKRLFLISSREIVPRFSISRMVLKSLKEDKQIPYIVAWFKKQYSNIRPAAIAKLLLIPLKEAEALLKDQSHICKNPVAVRLMSYDTIDEAIEWAEGVANAANNKKLSLQEISGIINWLGKEYDLNSIHYIQHILHPVTALKISRAIRAHPNAIIDPVANGIMSNEYLAKYIDISSSTKHN